jgi:hypothetical protein|tara:strand:+ start:109 stop:525 length:417 start_codon:yes stop_codon:yes gene_type:complete
MEYSDWIKSKHSARVWLDNSMMAQCQFATIKPIKKYKDFDGRRYTEYNYGIYTQDSGKDIRYLPTSETTHRNIQGKFRDNLEAGKNPTEFLWEVRRSLSNYGDYMIYQFTPLYLKGWIEERDRPPLTGTIEIEDIWET